MKLLAIDTSTSHATLALSLGDVVYTDEQDNLKAHAKELLPMIDAILIKSGVQLRELDGIVFGCGPGSFTGLRVTCSLAKALAYAHDLVMYPVSSLAAIAEEVYHTEANLLPNMKILAVLDARMQQLYWQSFAVSGTPVTAEQVTDAADIMITPAGSLLVAGVGFEDYQSQCSPQLLSQIVAHKVVYPHANAMIRLVKAGLIQSVSAAEAQPLYVRNSVAHIKKE
jgi:tRNA threonylcarbamoyladenosine biosynthesis protein TsaB